MSSCECDDGEYDASEIVDSIIGPIIGISVNTLTITATILITFTIICIVYLIVYDPINWVLMKIKGFVRYQVKIAFELFEKSNCCCFCCKVMIYFTKNVVDYILSLNPPKYAWILIIGMSIGLFFRFSGINETFDHTLMTMDGRIFSIVLLPPFFIRPAFIGIQPDLFFDNFVIVFLHTFIGPVFLCVTLSGVIFVLTLAKYSYFESFLLSSFLTGISPTAVLQGMKKLNLNNRIVSVLSIEAVITTPWIYAIFLIALNLTLEQQNREVLDIFAIAGLLISRFFINIGTGSMVGISFGFIGCILVRLTKKEALCVFQPFIVVLMLYLSFFITVIFTVHGVFGVIPCGFFMSRYSKFSMKPSSMVHTKYLITLGGEVSAKLILLYMGIALMRHTDDWDWGLISICIFFMIFFRVVFIVTVDTIWNIIFTLFRMKSKVFPRREIMVVACSGIKGLLPVLFAILSPETLQSRNVFLTTGMSCILFSFFVQEPLISAILPYLRINLKRLTIQEKIDYCNKLQTQLKRIRLLIPHPKTQPWMKKVMVREVNKSFGKFQVTCESYYQNCKYERENRKKFDEWPDDPKSAEIMDDIWIALQHLYFFSRFGMMEVEVEKLEDRVDFKEGVEENIESSRGRNQILFDNKYHNYKYYGMLLKKFEDHQSEDSTFFAKQSFISSKHGEEEEELQRAYDFRKTILEHEQEIKLRLVGLLQLELYTSGLINRKLRREDYLTTSISHGHIPHSFPIHLQTYWKSKNEGSIFSRGNEEQDEEETNMAKFNIFVFGLFCVNKIVFHISRVLFWVDRMIQKMVNTGGRSNRSKTFVESTFRLRDIGEDQDLLENDFKEDVVLGSMRGGGKKNRVSISKSFVENLYINNESINESSSDSSGYPEENGNGNGLVGMDVDVILEGVEDIEGNEET